MNTTVDNIHILLVEDDTKLARLTSDYLEQQGLLVSSESSGLVGLKVALNHQFDAILLDLMLPEMDGMEICRRLREKKDTPIIMITAKGEEADRVLGLEFGADDYITKPFSPRELLARIRAVVRRYRKNAGPVGDIVEIGNLRLCPQSCEAWLEDTLVDLTAHEFRLLYALADSAGRILSREQLMDIANPGGEESFDRAIDVHISRLRKKLGDDPKKPQMIRTVRGMGYIFKQDH